MAGVGYRRSLWDVAKKKKPRTKKRVSSPQEIAAHRAVMTDLRRRYDHAGEDVLLPHLVLVSERAKQLADLNSMLQDFEFAAKAFRKASETSRDDTLLLRAYGDSAVIAYRRCFGGGRSLSLSADRALRTRYQIPDPVLDGLTERQAEEHQEILDLANEHIAHRVDEREQGLIKVSLTRGPAAPEPGRLLISSLRREGSLPEKDASFARLCDWWVFHLEARCTELRQEMMDDDLPEFARRFYWVGDELHDSTLPGSPAVWDPSYGA